MSSCSHARRRSSTPSTRTKRGPGTPARSQVLRIDHLSRERIALGPAPRSPKRSQASATAWTAYSENVSTASARQRSAKASIADTSSS